MAKRRYYPIKPLADLHSLCGQICEELKTRVGWRYTGLHPFDDTEAELLEQMYHDEWRAESYWSMARTVEAFISLMGPRQRKSELGLEYEKLLVDYRQMVDRYDDLYFRELKQLLFHRDAVERRLLLQSYGGGRDEMAVEDFCVTMQSSI